MNNLFLLASEHGHIDIVNALLEYPDIEVNTVRKNSDTPLHVAAQCGYTDIVKALFQPGAKINHTDKMGHSALHQATIQGHTEIVRILLDHGVNKDLIFKERTALEIAKESMNLL